MALKLVDLRTRVARRTVLLFVLTAAVPTIVFFSSSYRSVAHELESLREERLAGAAEASAFAIFDRLLTIEQLLIALSFGEPTLSTPDRVLHYESRASFAPTRLESDHLATGGTVLRVTSDDSGPPVARFAWIADGRDDLAVLERNADSIWSTAGFYNANEPTSGFCVLIGSQPLSCSGSLASWEADGVPDGLFTDSETIRGLSIWTDNDPPIVMAFYDLFTVAQFGHESLRIVQGESETAYLGPLADFGRTLGLTGALGVTLVILLSTFEIRRSLEPLAELREGTRRLEEEKFGVPVLVSSDDEFGELATSFNRMSSRIGELVTDLRDFNTGTLVAFARTIDAKSPWTAGHSERVTELAVRMGEIMGFDAEDLLTLNQGGLLHDIGKIGIPAEILDKPGPLTPEERTVIQSHVEIGVRILEPIRSIAHLLPIVHDHHERFDGGGYPRGLAGTDIHPLARVLAVADTFDALIAARPYRGPLSQDRSVARILIDRGTAFDPDAVDAFFEAVLQSEDEGLTIPYGEGFA